MRQSGHEYAPNTSKRHVLIALDRLLDFEKVLFGHLSKLFVIQGSEKPGFF